MKRTDWFYPYVVSAYEQGIMTGIQEDIFGINRELTRAEFAVVLYGMAGKPEVEGESPFTDVKAGAWYEKAVTWASSRGIVSGYGNGKYGVGDRITREQMAVMLYSAAGRPPQTVSSDDFVRFGEASRISPWARDAMKWAVYNELIAGKAINGRLCLDPAGFTTRPEAATIMTRYGEM